MERADGSRFGRDRRPTVWSRLGRFFLGLLRPRPAPAARAVAALPHWPAPTPPPPALLVSGGPPDSYAAPSAPSDESAGVEAGGPLAVDPVASAVDLPVPVADPVARGTGGPILTPLVSVVVVTTDWPSSLASAVESVRRQSYSSWELLLVDRRQPAAPPPGPPGADGRVRALSSAGRSAAVAYNRALEAAQGQIVTYLADTVCMAPGWLDALARASGEWPAAGVYRGADGTDGQPGAVAHRQGLVRFDEDAAADLGVLLAGIPAYRLPDPATTAGPLPPG